MTGLETVRLADEICGGTLCPVIMIGAPEQELSQRDLQIIVKVCVDVKAQPFRGIDFVDCLREIF